MKKLLMALDAVASAACAQAAAVDWEVTATETEVNYSSPLFFEDMAKEISVFVDESGRFQQPDEMSRFYIVGLVLHDQSVEIGERVSALDRDWRNMGLANFCFHAGPLNLLDSADRGETGGWSADDDGRVALLPRTPYLQARHPARHQAS